MWELILCLRSCSFPFLSMCFCLFSPLDRMLEDDYSKPKMLILLGILLRLFL